MTIGEALGNAIAGYRDHDTKRCAEGLTEVVNELDLVRQDFRLACLWRERFRQALHEIQELSHRKITKQDLLEGIDRSIMRVFKEEQESIFLRAQTQTRADVARQRTT